MLPTHLELRLKEAIDTSLLHDVVHPYAAEWYAQNIQAIFNAYYQPTIEFLMMTTEENGPFSYIPPKIRMACYCIGMDAYTHVFHKTLDAGMSEQEDMMAGLFRFLVMIGWYMKESGFEGTIPGESNGANPPSTCDESGDLPTLPE